MADVTTAALQLHSCLPLATRHSSLAQQRNGALLGSALPWQPCSICRRSVRPATMGAARALHTPCTSIHNKKANYPVSQRQRLNSNGSVN